MIGSVVWFNENEAIKINKITTKDGEQHATKHQTHRTYTSKNNLNFIRVDI